MTKFEDWKNSLSGQKITVIGIGVSNRPLIRFLCENGAQVQACDKRTREQLGEVYEEFSRLGVAFSLGDGYLDDINGDIIYKTPGLRYDVPQLCAARERGAVVTSEMEVFFDVCPSTIIAVTGSDGKTTTTTLIHKMLTDAGHKTWLGGNIGNPLLTDADKMTPEDHVVLELSSFQLQTIKKSPHIAVITNISPNHLDMHKDYEEYIDAKVNIMRYQSPDDRLIINYDNEVTRELGKNAAGEAVYFSRREKADICLDGDWITRHGDRVLNIHDIKIPGMHNVENYMAAIGAVMGLVPDEVIVNTAKEFGGVEHRIELVREANGVKYYNSSIDSSPNRTINTLAVFKQKVIMIGGGKDKGIPYDDVGPAIADHVKTLILIGATAGKIEEAVKKTGRADDIDIVHCDTYEKAVKTAAAAAKPGDIVVLSPASTSFDMFANFMERGNLFKELVNRL